MATFKDIYLQAILKRDKNELIRRVYDAQKANPKQGDFVLLVQNDAELVNLVLQEEAIEKMGKKDFQIIVKSAVRKAAFAITANPLKV